MTWRGGAAGGAAARWRAAIAVATVVAVPMVAVACGKDRDIPARSLRYGIFRDLVLYERDDALGGAFFIDRFETTRADWQTFLDATAGPSEPSDDELRGLYRWLPAVKVSLRDARRYAAWRFCRLPRYDEWRFAATGGGRYTFPWGDRFVAEWVNSWDLGLDAPTTVGTFESGREWGGAYDLLGNVAEWTESVAPHWFDTQGTPRTAAGLLPSAVDSVAELRASGCWLLDGLPPPAFWMIESVGEEVPRLVVGGHFRSLMDPNTPELPESPGPWPGYEGQGPLWERQAGERGETVGVRLAVNPMELVAALLREPDMPTAADMAYLRDFLALEAHQRVLVAPWRWCLERVAPTGPLAAVLGEVLEQ